MSAPNPYKLRPFSTLGRSGLRIWAGRVDEEWHNSLRGIKGIRIFREMSDNDPVIGGFLHLVNSLVRQTEFTAQSNGDRPDQKEAADFLESCLDDMDGTWEDFLSECLSMLIYGWSFFEVTYKQRLGDQPRQLVEPSRYNDFRIGWKAFELRSQDSLDHWEVDDSTDRVTGLWQLPPPHFVRTFVPLEKALLFRTTTHKDNPQGRSILRNCYRPWYIKKRLEEVEAYGIERDLAGLPVMEVPPQLLSAGATDEQKALLADLETIVTQIRRDEREGAIVPAEKITNDNGQEETTGFKLKLLTAGGSRQLQIGEAIERHEHRIAVSLLSEFMLLGSTHSGSRALSSDKTEMFAVALNAIIDVICSVVNRHAVPTLMRLNGYLPDQWPELTHGAIEAPELGMIADYVSKLITSGAIVPDKDLEGKLREIADLPEAGDPLVEAGTGDVLVQPNTVMAFDPPPVTPGIGHGFGASQGGTSMSKRKKSRKKKD